MKKKVLSICLVAVIAVMAIAGASLAYLTDTDEAKNVFTVGNVKIVQNEQDRNGEAFKPNQTLMPLVTPAGTKDEAGYPACENYIDKIVTVTNNGKNNAYVRTFIAIPVYTYEGQDTQGAFDNVLHWNGYSEGDTSDKYPAATRIPGTDINVENHWYWGQNGKGSWPGNGGAWNSFKATIDGKKYTVYVVTHTTSLAEDETTAPNMIGVYLDSKVDFDGTNFTYNGKVIEGFDGNVEILVATQAVQADGFDDAWTALDTAFGAASAANNPWVETSK